LVACFVRDEEAVGSNPATPTSTLDRAIMTITNSPARSSARP